MQFLHEKSAGESPLVLSGENYKYLFKVRRFKEGDFLDLRNLQDGFLYRYKIEEVSKKEALLVLVETLEKGSELFYLHLIWCVIDPKVVEKSLPMLNQLGVDKITFVYCDRSQRNFRLDQKRLQKILINSSQQCGRASLMKLEFYQNLEEVLKSYPNVSVLDFGGKSAWQEIASVLVGCEGGFSPKERELLQESEKIGFKTPHILKSETAAVAIAAKLLI